MWRARRARPSRPCSGFLQHDEGAVNADSGETAGDGPAARERISGMPGMDGTGPFGDGRPGRGLGPCGRGMARGRGMGRGLGAGRGMGRGIAAAPQDGQTMMDVLMQRLDDLAAKVEELRGNKAE